MGLQRSLGSRRLKAVKGAIEYAMPPTSGRKRPACSKESRQKPAGTPSHFGTAEDIEKAQSLLAPRRDARLEMLAALIESRRGNDAAALERYRQAVQADPDNLKARYALSQALDLARSRAAPGAARGPNDTEGRE